MKNAVRTLIVASLALPALGLAQIPSTADLNAQGNAAAAQTTDSAKTEGKKQSKKAVDTGAAKTGSVGAALAPTATDTANKGVDKGVDKAAEKAGIK
jgi:hypothetical protein